MINIFQFGSDDKSLVYLNQLFGSMNGIIPNPEGTPGTQTISLLGTMFQTFNTVVLAVAAIVVVYVTIVGVIATAHEGEFLGKKWGGVWGPIRIVLGIATLVPAGSGYSGIQMIMMWIIVQGIGAADTLWNTVLSYINTTGSANGQITLLTSGVPTTMGQLFQSLTCDATGRLPIKNTPGGSNSGGYFCGSHTCKTNPFQPTTSSNTYNIGPNNGNCGTLTFCNQSDVCTGSSASNNANSIACALCKAQVTALQSIIPTLSGVATQFAQTDYAYRDFYYNSGTGQGPSQGANWSWIYNYCSQNGVGSTKNCCNPSPSPIAQKKGITCSDAVVFPTPNQDNTATNASTQAVSQLYWPYSLKPSLGNVNYVDIASNYYISELTNALTAAIAAQGQNSNSFNNNDAVFAEAQQIGWIYAGAFYFTLTSMNNAQQATILPDFSVGGNLPQSSSMSSYRNNYNAASTLDSLLPAATGDTQESTQYSTLTLPKAPATKTQTATTVTNIVMAVVAPLSLAVQGLITGIIAIFKSTLMSAMTGQNPMVSLANAGNNILLSLYTAYSGMMVVSYLAGMASGINGWALGFGLINPMIFGLLIIFFLVAPVVVMMLTLFFILGGLLGTYVPLIPYMVFTIGAISWFILTIEVLVAAPLVAVGILSPNNQGHEILGKSEPALMMLFNVFLRPSLMIFGLMAAMILATIVVTMINFAFWAVVGSISSAPSASFLSSGQLAEVMFLMIYVMFVIGALNKCFKLIDHLPDRVLTWAGGKGDRMDGSDHMLGEIKSAGQEAGAREMRGAVESRTGEAHQLGREKGAKMEPQKAQPGQFKGSNPPGGGGGDGPPGA